MPRRGRPGAGEANGERAASWTMNNNNTELESAVEGGISGGGGEQTLAGGRAAEDGGWGRPGEGLGGQVGGYG